MAVAAKITPVLRYRAPRTAARWLCEAFGFSEHETVEGADGDIAYVLLRSGQSFVLVLPDAGLEGLLVQPQAVGGANTQVCYVTVADVAAHRARAEGAGARIEIAPQDDGLGGQFYTCRDFEGHLWSFGTRAYGPAEAEAQGLAPADAELPVGDSTGRGLARGVAVVALFMLAAFAGWLAHRTYAGSNAAAVSMARTDGALKQLAGERERLAAAESASREAEEKLAEQLATAGDVRRALQQAQSDLLQTRSELALERQRKGESATALASLKGAAAELEQGKRRAEAELAAGRERVAQEKALAKAAAERAAALQAQIEKLQQDRGAEREDLNRAKTALQGAQAQLAKLQQDRAAEREELNRAKATLQGAQAQLKVLREAKAELKAEVAGQPPAGGAAENLAESSPSAQSPDAGKVSTGSVATGSVKVPDLPEAKAAQPKGVCAAAVQGKWKQAGAWAARLCQGAETSPEPVRCYEELMRGKVSWGGGKGWTAPHALNLCSGTRNAQKTLDCFTEKIAADEPWQAAIQGCRSN